MPGYMQLWEADPGPTILRRSKLESFDPFIVWLEMPKPESRPARTLAVAEFADGRWIDPTNSKPYAPDVADWLCRVVRFQASMSFCGIRVIGIGVKSKEPSRL